MTFARRQIVGLADFRPNSSSLSLEHERVQPGAGQSDLTQPGPADASVPRAKTPGVQIPRHVRRFRRRFGCVSTPFGTYFASAQIRRLFWKAASTKGNRNGVHIQHGPRTPDMPLGRAGWHGEQQRFLNIATAGCATVAQFRRLHPVIGSVFLESLGLAISVTAF